MSRARWILLLVSLLGLGSPIAAQVESGSRQDYERSVVSLEVTYQLWDEDRPWTKRVPKARTANAVLVDERNVLTTAELLDHATFLKLSTFGRARRGEPRVVLIDPDVNLALVELDPAGMEGLQPVAVGKHTPTSGVLRTVRWRDQQFESAASRVVRFEVERSWGSRVEHAFLHMRTDMTGGGWAEPVFDEGKLVGITASQSKQVSRAIPVEIIRAFLERASAPGPYVGFPAFGASWQVNRDPAVTRFLGQVGEPTGIVVRQAPWGSSACGILRPMDILLQLGDAVIDAEGYYRHPRLGQLLFTHLLTEQYRPGQEIPVRILRDGKELELKMPLRRYPAALDLIPFRREGQPPYVVAGGLVFRELDRPYLTTWGSDWDEHAPVGLRTRYYLRNQGQTPSSRRIVLISSVLPATYNIGYQDLRDEIVERVNGRPIGRIEDVVEALKTPVEGFHVFDLAPDSSRRQVVLDGAAFEEATARILEDYRIPEGLAVRSATLPPGGGHCDGDY